MTELAILQILKGTTNVSAIVGNNISLSYIPQNATPPMVLLTIESNEKAATKDGDRREDLTINVQSIAEDLASGLVLDQKIFNVIHHYNQISPTTLSSGEVININHSYQLTTRSEWNEEINYHVIISTYRVLSDIS